MINQDSILVILFSLPVYQILFYTVQLLSFKRKNPSKKYLGLLLLCMTVFLVLNAIHSLGYIELFSDLFIIYHPVLLSIAPSFFLYILSITRENHDVEKKQRIILFLPTVFILIVNVFIIILSDRSSRAAFLHDGLMGAGVHSAQFPIFMIIWMTGIILVFFQIIFAIIKLFKIIQTENETMRKQPSHLAYLEWPWVIGISISALVFLVVNAIFGLIWPTNHLGISMVFNLLMLLSGGIVGYLGMKQDDLLNQVVNIGMPSVTNSAASSKNLSETLARQLDPGIISQSDATKLHNELMMLMENEKPFLNQHYTMQDLCHQLSISRRKLSYLLNEILNKNFYGVINEYRVKHAEELLLKDESDKLKIETLGEMVGFQSKSSFYACFKKQTGLTPKEYKSLHRPGN